MEKPTSVREATIASTVLPYLAVALAVIGLIVGGLAMNKKGTSGSGSSGAAATVVEVTLREFSITPTHIMVPPGPVTIKVTNAGSMQHNFSIKGLGALPLLAAGETKTLELANVAAGTYDTLCTVPGHEASGMKGTMMAAVGADVSANAATSASGTPGAVLVGGDGTMTNEQMDAMMLAVAERFPEKTAGHGGDELAPAIQADGTKQFELTAKVVDWEVEKGKIVKAWTYNGVVPAPTIHVNVGDKVRVILHNDLPESTSLHFHGIRVPNKYDGVDPYTQPPTVPGDSFTYEFTALEPSVGMYHSHHDAQIQIPNGMAGAFLIGEMPIPASLGKVNVAKHYNMVLNDAGTIGLSLNGKSFPATEPVTLKVGESIVVNYLNEGLMGHPMHMHQPIGYIIAKDGKPLKEPMPGDTIFVAPGERYTVLYTATDPGVWAWHCHILNHAETPQGMTGMVTALIVEQ
jgi:uncharacterized cupredoxin-like copper-binding protein